MTKQKSQQQRLHHCEVVLYGRCDELKDNFPRASLFARNRGGDSTCLIVPPNNNDLGLRFSILEKYLPNSVVNAHGLILDMKGQAAIVESRDCPTVVIEHRTTGNVGVLHAGREQLINRENCCQKTGVIERIIPALGPLNGNLLNVYITGGISAQYFEHTDLRYVEPFTELYGSEVIIDKSKLTLDLAGAIKAILRKYGVPEKNIKHDGLCTFETPWLGSHRAQKAGTNWTLVVKK